MGEIGFERIFLLPYSPELNPCERIFEWLRAKIEGEVYKSLEHKRYVIEQHLRRLSSNKNSLRQLIEWEWIQNAFDTCFRFVQTETLEWLPLNI
jgi:transposase